MALARLVWAALTHGGAGASGSLAAATSFAHGSTMGTVSSASSAASLLRGALAHRAPLCTQPPNELLLQRLASSSSSSSAACSSSASAAAVAVGRTLLRHAAPLPVPGSAALRQPHAGKRGFGSTAGGSSAGAGGSGSGGAAPRNILEHAAEAQMQKLKTKPDPAHHHQQQEPPGVVSRVLGVLVDAAALGVGGFLLFSGYYTLTHPDIADLDVALSNAHKSLELAAGGGSGGAPAPAAAPAPPSSAPAGKTSSVVLPPPPSAVEPAAFPPLTQAWCAVMDRYLGIRRYVEKSIRDFRDPTYHKLLPDMAPELKGRIKTLVLDLDDLLVHKEWTRQYGWKIYKRPGVQDFLLEMGGYYELVIFTDAPATYAEPIITKLDPHRVVLYRLYRPETQYHNGKHVRDLSKLNRDLSQVLMISCNPEAWEFQPENTLKIKPWHHSDAADTTLLDLIPMLQLIATKGIRDVRDVVKSYDGQEDIPRAFKERMAQVAGQQKQPKQRGFLGSIAK